MKSDHIYATPLAGIADFQFDAQVADVFTDMIQRSVPGYRSIITMIETLTAHYAQPDTTLYDLGCSLGAATLSMRHGITATGCNIVSIDNSSEMVTRCKKNVARDHSITPVQVLHGDILELDISNASVVVMNFTLQFIAREKRGELLRRIAAGMVKGGVLILSEKVVFNDPHHNELMIDIHHDYKRAHGYSDLEISQKRSALENVLIPETIDTHKNRLQNAGFSSCDLWFQCFNFMSMLAVK
jgi:tRNA (cmo5U34)-methyltransferase